jgi:hypothetical protein
MGDHYVSYKPKYFNNYSNANGLIGLDCFDRRSFSSSQYDDTIRTDKL